VRTMGWVSRLGLKQAVELCVEVARALLDRLHGRVPVLAAGVDQLAVAVTRHERRPADLAAGLLLRSAHRGPRAPARSPTHGLLSLR
jgi:hypothetical protein